MYYNDSYMCVRDVNNSFITKQHMIITLIISDFTNNEIKTDTSIKQTEIVIHNENMKGLDSQDSMAIFWLDEIPVAMIVLKLFRYSSEINNCVIEYVDFNSSYCFIHNNKIWEKKNIIMSISELKNSERQEHQKVYKNICKCLSKYGRSNNNNAMYTSKQHLNIPLHKKNNINSDTNNTNKLRYRKQKIPAALRVAVWNKYCGEVYKTKCFVRCGETISVHNFECGHIIAESKGGLTRISNLRPICSRCNASIGTDNMIDFMKWYGFVSK